jgi:hypothetical protein
MPNDKGFAVLDKKTDKTRRINLCLILVLATEIRTRLVFLSCLWFTVLTTQDKRYDKT